MAQVTRRDFIRGMVAAGGIGALATTATRFGRNFAASASLNRERTMERSTPSMSAWLTVRSHPFPWVSSQSPSPTACQWNIVRRNKARHSSITSQSR